MTLDKMSPDKVAMDKMSGMYESNEYTHSRALYADNVCVTVLIQSVLLLLLCCRYLLMIY